MLIEFSVSNFRSFREKQTFSMVATPRLSKKRNVFKAPLKGERFPDLLKVAAIYGPNASGKTSLLQAMSVMNNLLVVPASSDRVFPVKPFRFDSVLREKPSEFEYNFIKNGLRYQFILGLTEKRITEEKLIFFPKGKEALLYDRRLTETGEVYTFGDELEGGKEVNEIWRRLTSPKSLFIAQAVANSSEDLNQLRGPYEWFFQDFLVIGQDSMGAWSAASRNFLKKIPGLSSDLETFLREVDVPVSKITFEHDEDDFSFLNSGRRFGVDDFLGSDEIKTTLTHESLLGEAEFDFSEESGGTKNLIGFWLPWRNINRGNAFGILAVDELDSSLHPEVVADLIDKHLENGTASQLIFTTHDTHLMNTKALRRDQFWITERDANGATNLFSIHDFEGREGEDVEKRYFEGRYRGLPLIRRK